MSRVGDQSPVEGWTAAGFEPVRRVFEDSFSQGIDKGAALSFYFKGNLVVNIWGGMADASIERPWKEETYSHLWSCTKIFSGVVIAHLVERGLLDYGERVCKYWPEFSQNGKDTITLDHILSHSAGVPVGREEYKMSWIRDDPKRLSAYLASLTPFWEPGTKHGYCSFLYSLFLNEIVKRVDVKERTLAQYFDEEIAKPFGLDLYIGLPKSLYYRVNRNTWSTLSKEEEAEKLKTFEGDWELLALQNKRTDDLNLKFRIEDPDFASLGVGSLHGVGTAKATAQFAGILANGGGCDGKVMLTPESIDRMRTPLTYGRDCIFSLNGTYGRGGEVVMARQNDQLWTILEQTGYGGQVMWSDPKYKMGFAYCTNYMDLSTDFDANNWRQPLDVFYQCASRIEGINSGDKVTLSQGYTKEMENANSRL